MENNREDNFAVKEAELIIENFIRKSERKIDVKNNKKYKILKIYSIIVTFALIIAIVI